MSKINVLSKQVYNKIAAGEVVDRPASIVKELFENSVDAGAKHITVEIENGGINSIIVSDDGCGIESSELEKVFLPHCTSKISSADDLYFVSTLGFRGEAMSSISAVSKVRLVTRNAADEVGSCISVEGGEISAAKKEQCEIGTTVSVSGIFFNTPARLKFLKSPKSEENEITSMMEKLALSQPDVAIKYVVNSSVKLQTYGDGLKGAVLAVYGKRTMDNCLEISTEQNGLKIEGFLGNSNFVKSNKSYQTLIVNGRCVQDALVSSAVHNAYAPYLMKRQYPFYVLCLTVPSEKVDVNVHPRKAEVRFQDTQNIYGTIYKVVSGVVDGAGRALEIVKPPKDVIYRGADEQSETVYTYETLHSSKNESCEQKTPEENSAESFSGAESQAQTEKSRTDLPFPSAMKKPQKRYEPMRYVNEKGEMVYAPYDTTIYESPFSQVSDRVRVNKLDFRDQEFVNKLKEKVEREENPPEPTQLNMGLDAPLGLSGQIFGTYLIFERGNEIYIVDQHAAHEKFLYDKLVSDVQKRKVVSQQLLVPYSVTVNAVESDMLYEIMDYLQEIGVDMAPDEENSYKIYAVPDDLVGMDIEKFFYDILSDEKFRDEKIPTVIRESLMQKACKAAVKAGDKLSGDEVIALREKLKNNLGLKCPHGRPAVLKITKRELEVWFRRIV